VADGTVVRRGWGGSSTRLAYWKLCSLLAARCSLLAARILKRMTRPESERPTPPRRPSNLPSEPDLRLTAGSEINRITIQGDCSDGGLEGLLVEDSHIVHSSFTAADLNRLRLVDVLVKGSDFSGADMEEACFTRVIFSGCRMSGAALPLDPDARCHPLRSQA
jgi:Pentapeptide repeats (8 copies)